MDRREAVSYISVLMGGTVVGSSFFLSGCKNNEGVSIVFSKKGIELPDDIAETILPKTNTPGAKEAGVGKFMPVMVIDCYEKEDQNIFHKGMKQLNDFSREKAGNLFSKLTADKKTEILIAPDKEQKEYQKNKKAGECSHYFRMRKELTLPGYFTSETGATQPLRYVERPGSYNRCLPYKKGDRAWAT